MPKQLAIALCRVSTPEQLENNSLNRQRDAVLKAAETLGVTIPDEYWLSGSVSSKRGKTLRGRTCSGLSNSAKKISELNTLL